MELTESDFLYLGHCPWDETDEYDKFYIDAFGGEVVRCRHCGAIYARKRLNESGLGKFWKNYSSRLHTSDISALEKRRKMYEIDYEFIHGFISNGEVLDIGCGEGNFLDVFARNGYGTSGVEYGSEAASISKKKHRLWEGVLPQIKIDDKFDLIIFRGVLQYVVDPKAYLKKAIDLLNPNGYVYITSQPNGNSLCANLFRDKFTMPVNGVELIAFNEKMLTKYFMDKGCRKAGETYFYEGTPYADVENDIITVAKAIELKRKNQIIDFKSPAFYGNMMTLVYQKCTC